MHELAELASQWGVELAYTDGQGRRRESDPGAVRRILAALSACSDHPSNRRLTDFDSRAYQGPEDLRGWLLIVQLYGIRSSANWGHGDFGDLAQLIRVASEVGAAGVGLNPLHALFPDRPEQASPYAPNSRLFLNALYIDVAAAPGFPGVSELGLAENLARLRNSSLVDYSGVARAKISALRVSYRRFLKEKTGQNEFSAFQTEKGATLERFAVFETLRRKFKEAWWEWPEEWRQPSEHALRTVRESDPDEVGFQAYVQWVADRQLRACQQLARDCGCPVGLYIDLAVGVDAGGADAWAEQDVFLKGLSIGAPPDALNLEGQDWGLTTYNPHCLIARDFAPFRQLLATTMKYAGAIRLDHVLGLNRIFVIPWGMKGEQGTYLRFPLDHLLAVIAQESQRHKCIVIGEDLGTVPDGFRQKLTDRGIWRYLVMLFEREHDGTFRPPDRYPVDALASFATHDIATFAGWSGAHDIRIKRTLNMDPGETQSERSAACIALKAALEQDRDDDGFVAVIRFLASTPAKLVAIAAEDVWEVLDQINIPGTVHEHPNWRRKLPVTIDQMHTDDRLHRVAAGLAQSGRN